MGVAECATNDNRCAATTGDVNCHALKQEAGNVTSARNTRHDIRIGIQVSSHNAVPQPLAPKALVAQVNANNVPILGVLISGSLRPH